MVDDLVSRTPGRLTEPTAVTQKEISAVPVLQRSCTSKSSPAELKAFFTDAFKKAGLQLGAAPAELKGESAQQVSATDTESLITYMAVIQPGSAGNPTLVVVAAADVGKATHVVKGTDAVAPVFPGSHDVTSYHVDMMRGMTYACPATPAQIKQFYRDELGKLGFQEADPLVFIKDQTRAWVSVGPGLSERIVSVYLQDVPAGVDPKRVAAPPTYRVSPQQPPAFGH
jgi:hypothetical protein